MQRYHVFNPNLCQPGRHPRMLHRLSWREADGRPGQFVIQPTAISAWSRPPQGLMFQWTCQGASERGGLLLMVQILDVELMFALVRTWPEASFHLPWGIYNLITVLL